MIKSVKSDLEKDSFNLEFSALRELMDGNTAASWVLTSEVLGIDFIDACEICHICKEDGRLDGII